MIDNEFAFTPATELYFERIDRLDSHRCGKLFDGCVGDKPSWDTSGPERSRLTLRTSAGA